MRIPIVPARVPRLVAPTLALAALLLLAACGRGPEPVPELTLEPNAAGTWFVTSPTVELASFATLRLELTVRNDSGIDMVFDPAETEKVQVWSDPGIESPPVTVETYPSGTVVAGDSFEMVVVVDLASLPATETVIAVRPRSQSHGTMGPGKVTVTAQTLVLAR